jgi:enoyl-CoA hydratase
MAVETTIENGVAVLTLNRAEALNALNTQLISELGKALDVIEDSDCRGVVIVGKGDKAFCAGADIGELSTRSLTEQRDFARRGQATFARLAELQVPSVAVIHGYAFGGGLELALACTFRIATPKARMGLPEIKLGLIPGYGGTQRLPRLIGEARALELILSGRAMGADEALQVGLVNRIAEAGSPVEIGTAYLDQFKNYSLVASRLARESVQRGLQTSLAEGLAIEADVFALCSQSSDAAEGMQAFLEKRPAVFTDR